MITSYMYCLGNKQIKVYALYGHFGPKTFRHWYHRKNPRHFGTGAEVSARHFGTSAEMCWTFWHHLYFVHRSVTLIYLFKKDFTLLMMQFRRIESNSNLLAVMILSRNYRHITGTSVRSLH